MADQVKSDRRDSIAWCSLAYVAGKRGDRKSLEDGLSEKVCLDITGKVGRTKFADSIVGRLSIAYPQESASTSAASAADVLAAMLNELPNDDARAKAVNRLIDQFEKHGGEFVTPIQIVKKAKACMKRLRAKNTNPKAGNLVFESA